MSFPNMLAGSFDNISGPIPCRRFVEQCVPSAVAGVPPGGSTISTLVTNFPNSSYTFVAPVEFPILNFDANYLDFVSLNSISCFPGWNYITTGFLWDTAGKDFKISCSFVGSEGLPMFTPLVLGSNSTLQNPYNVDLNDEKVITLANVEANGRYSFSRWIYCGLPSEGASDDPNVTDINKLTVALSIVTPDSVQCREFFLSSMSMNALVANAGIA